MTNLCSVRGSVKVEWIRPVPVLWSLLHSVVVIYLEKSTYRPIVPRVADTISDLLYFFINTKMLELPETIEMYNCKQCSHRTESDFQLAHHVQRNHTNVYAAELYHAIVKPQQFPCICCDYKSYYQFELYEHCEQKHSREMTGNTENVTFCRKIERLPCDYCGYKSDSSLFSVKHLYLCGKDPTIGVLQETREENLESSDLDQPRARRSVRDIGLMKLNMSTHDSNEKIYEYYYCNHCSYRATRKWHLKRHMLTHAANEEINWFQCNHCSFRAKEKSNLRKHSMLKHAASEEINWFKCNHCPYLSKYKSYLTKHMKYKHTANEEINWFQCSHCLYRAKNNSNLKGHLISKHAANGEINWFQCNYCSFRAKHNSNLKKHIMNKHAANDEINWFQCNHCSYRAKQKSHLKRHMLNHVANEEINWFQCSHCLYRSKWKADLRRHAETCC